MKRLMCWLFFVGILHAGLVTLAAAAASAQNTAPSANEKKVIVFFGDSLTAGYGLAPGQSFPAVIQEKINAQGWNFHAINAGVSGETTAGGLRRVDWVLQRPIDVFVLELGANDGLRGVDVNLTKANLQAIIDRVKEKYPHATIILAGMHIPANLGRDYTTRFREIFPALAEANNIALIPFLLEGVAGKRALNLPDGIHPTAEGQRIVAENVWSVLEPVLRSMQFIDTLR